MGLTLKSWDQLSQTVPFASMALCATRVYENTE